MNSEVNSVFDGSKLVERSLKKNDNYIFLSKISKNFKK